MDPIRLLKLFKTLVPLLIACALILGITTSCDSGPSLPGIDDINSVVLDNGKLTFNLDDFGSFSYKLKDLRDDRGGDGIIDPGSDMDADEIRQYMAVSITNACAPTGQEYAFYVQCRLAFDAQPDTFFLEIVELYEGYGFDFPPAPPPDAPQPPD